MTPLEKSLILSYVHNKLAIKNLDTVVHELKVVSDPNAGKMQHSLEKLIAANRKAYSTLEKNMKNMGELGKIEADLELMMDEIWGSEIEETTNN